MPRKKTIKLNWYGDIYEQFAAQAGISRHDAKKLMYPILYDNATSTKYNIQFEEYNDNQAQTV